MAEALSEALAASAAAIFAAGGTIFLSVAVQGERWWPPDKADRVYTNTERYLCGALGVLLVIPIFYWLFYALPGEGHSPKVTSATEGSAPREMKALEARVIKLEAEPETVTRLASLSAEVRNLRAASMEGDPSRRTCNEASTKRSWMEKPTTACDRMKNDAWTVEIPGDLAPFAAGLLAYLDSVQIPYVVGPAQGKYLKQTSGMPSGLGMVFDSDVPGDLVCKIHEEYVAATTHALEYAVTQDTVLEYSSPPANLSSYAIRLGVSFPAMFPNLNLQEKIIDWGLLCKDSKKKNSNGEPDQAFLDGFDRHFKAWAVGYQLPRQSAVNPGENRK